MTDHAVLRMRSFVLLCCLVVSAVILCGCDTVENPPEEVNPPEEELEPGVQLLARPEAGVEQFGIALDTDGNRVIVGTGSSVAYIYEWDGSQWGEQAELRLDDVSNVRFLTEVAISGDRAVVGLRGAARVFTWNGAEWSQEAELVGSTEKSYRVAIDGDRIVLGDPSYTDEQRREQGLPGPGIAHVYEWDGRRWVATATLSPSDGRVFDRFGMEVVLDGDRLAVVTRNQDAGGGAAPSNRIHFFDWNGQAWIERSISEYVGFSFRSSLALDDNHLVAGQTNDWSMDLQGEVLFFERMGTTWGEVIRLENPEEKTDDHDPGYDEFGSAVAVEDGIAVVGAPGHPVEDYSRDEGAVHVYRLEDGQWRWVRKLTIDDLPIDFQNREMALGSATALEQGVLFIGASGDNAQGSGSGAVFTYSFPRNPTWP